MSEWLDDFIETYKTYKDMEKCLNKNSIDKQAICLIKLNAPKKKKKRKKSRRR